MTCALPPLCVCILDIYVSQGCSESKSMFLIMSVAAVLAALVQLPGIVGAFLAGLAVNAAVRDRPAKEKVKFFGDALFVPCFFVVTGFLINPPEFYHSITKNFVLAAAVVGAVIS